MRLSCLCTAQAGHRAGVNPQRRHSRGYKVVVCWTPAFALVALRHCLWIAYLGLISSPFLFAFSHRQQLNMTWGEDKVSNKVQALGIQPAADHGGAMLFAELCKVIGLDDL